MRILVGLIWGIAAYLAGVAAIVCVVWLTVWITEHT